MAMFMAGSMLKEFRTQRGITLDKLSNGICNVSTLWRIENGERVPSNFVFKTLLERLGYEARKYYFNPSSKAELEFFNMYNKILALIMEREFDEAAILYREIDDTDISDFDELPRNDGRNIKHQMLLNLKSNIALGKDEDIDKVYDMVHFALSLTLPGFDEEMIDEYMLSYEEIALINLLATIYDKLGNTSKKISILYKVKRSMDKYYVDEYEKSRGYSTTLYNLSNALGQSKRFRETIEICDEALKCCIKNKRLHLVPHINFNKAYALFYTGGDPWEYRPLVVQAYYAMKNNGDNNFAKSLKEFAEKKMGITFEY